jgi:hypothetical protein
MICSSRSRDKFVKEGLDYSTAKYKATYAYYYLPNEISKVAQRVRRDPYNEIHQECLANLKNSKTVLLNAKTAGQCNYIMDKLYKDINHEFDLGGN